jgi:hypothetical protein
MKRYGVAFTPRVRGYSENISPATAGKPEAGDASGTLQERPKTTKEKN